MKLRPLTDDREVIPARAWEAIKVAIKAIGEDYGVRIEFDQDVAFRDEIARIFRESRGQ